MWLPVLTSLTVRPVQVRWWYSPLSVEPTGVMSNWEMVSAEFQEGR